MANQNSTNDQLGMYGSGPCQMMMQAATGGFDQAFKAWDPVTKAMMRANLEYIALANRRAQAYLDIPTRLAQCRTPQDLVGEQARFWQSAASQYQESGRQVLSLWSAAVPAFNMFGLERASEAVRDYITFPEPGEPSQEPSYDRQRSSRRAAA